MQKIKIILFIVMIVLLNYRISIAFDDVDTHPQITEAAANSSILNTYLSQSLGIEFSKNLDTIVKGDKVIKWIKKGSTDEDKLPSTCRASNHFHDPTKSWFLAGLSGDQGKLSLAVDFSCSFTDFTEKYSNAVWATGHSSPDPDGVRFSYNDKDWNHARTFYMNALTASSKIDREINFAGTFYSLGHVMHLLQDMAVPAHVRNDFKAHFYKRRDFSFIDSNDPSTLRANPFEDYMKDHKNWDLIRGSSVATINDTTDVPVTRFWDTDTYNGNNATSIQSIGLAEFTNANFFSENSIFAENRDPNDARYFAHPAKDETDANHVEEIAARDRRIDKRRYVYKPDIGINVAA